MVNCQFFHDDPDRNCPNEADNRLNDGTPVCEHHAQDDTLDELRRPVGTTSNPWPARGSNELAAGGANGGESR